MEAHPMLRVLQENNNTSSNDDDLAVSYLIRFGVVFAIFFGYFIYQAFASKPKLEDDPYNERPSISEHDAQAMQSVTFVSGSGRQVVIAQPVRSADERVVSTREAELMTEVNSTPAQVISARVVSRDGALGEDKSTEDPRKSETDNSASSSHRDLETEVQQEQTASKPEQSSIAPEQLL